MKAILAAFVIVSAGLNSGSAAGRPKEAMFPPDVGWEADFLADHGEPPLWTASALKGFKSRLRLSIAGINRLRVIVRIDQHRHGSFTGVYISDWQSDHGVVETARDSLRISRKEMTSFYDLAKQRGILIKPRQGWSLAEDEICLDGEEVLIELVDAMGYRAAAANVSCTAPADFVDVAERILDIADAKEAKRLLLR